MALSEQRLSANDSNGYRVDCECDVIRDDSTGEVSIRLNLPHFEEVSLPNDLGLLLRTIGLVLNTCCLEAGLHAIDGWIETRHYMDKLECLMERSGLLDEDN